MTAIDAREALNEAALRRGRRGDIATRVAKTLSLAAAATWLAVVIWWTVKLWLMLRDAAPVLDMFEAEAGRRLTSDEWLMHREARKVFCLHEGVDPATNRIGRYIDGGLAYGPALAIGGLVAAVAGVLTGLFLLVADPLIRSGLIRAMLLAAVFSALPIILHWDDIGALTQITE